MVYRLESVALNDPRGQNTIPCQNLHIVSPAVHEIPSESNILVLEIAFLFLMLLTPSIFWFTKS